MWSLLASLVLHAVATTDDASTRDLARDVAYLVMPDRFIETREPLDVDARGHIVGGTLRDVRAHLPELQALGVTLLWLTPLHLQVATSVVDEHGVRTDAYHGYWPERLDALDPRLGTNEDLDALLREAHALGIDVMLDVVTNHLGYGSSRAHDPRWTRTGDGSCGDDARTQCLFGLPDLKTDDPAVADAVVEQTSWWAERFAIDGFRFDAMKHVDASVLQRIRARARAARGASFVVVGEHWGLTPGDGTLDALVRDHVVDTAFDFGFTGLARDFVAGRMRPAAFAHALEERSQTLRQERMLLHFLDNHDLPTFAHAVPSTRAPLGAALLLATPGVPTLMWGDEVQRVGGGIDPDNRAPMPWSLVRAQQGDAASPWHFWRALVHLRTSSRALQAGSLQVLAQAGDANAGVVAWERVVDGERVIVVVTVGRPWTGSFGIAADAKVRSVVWRAPPPRTEGKSLVVDLPADAALVVQIDDALPRTHEAP